MHGDLVLGGPVYWIAIVFLWSVGLASLWAAIDPLRQRRAPGFEGRPESRWFYAVPQGLYFLVFVAAQFGVVASAVVLLSLLVLAQQIAYLLRIVYRLPQAGPPAVQAEPGGPLDSPVDASNKPSSHE